MMTKSLLAALAAAALLQMPLSAQAFECPKHFDEPQALIDKVLADMKGMEGQMSKDENALVHALLDDAKTRLAGARHNHEKPQGAYDHARSIAKADAAMGYARAAELLHQSYMK